MQYLIPEDLANAVIGYLARQPFADVEPLISALRQLKPPADTEQNSKPQEED